MNYNVTLHKLITNLVLIDLSGWLQFEGCSCYTGNTTAGKNLGFLEKVLRFLKVFSI